MSSQVDSSVSGSVAALDAIIGADGQEAVFSLALSQDQKDIRDWVHGFAADVVRPAAHEWDEKEQTPWPIIQEAAKIGLYGFEGLAQFFADPSGLTLTLVNEELFWGDAGIGMILTIALRREFAEAHGVWEFLWVLEDGRVTEAMVNQPPYFESFRALLFERAAGDSA
jgi:hypothetical protein